MSHKRVKSSQEGKFACEKEKRDQNETTRTTDINWEAMVESRSGPREGFPSEQEANWHVSWLTVVSRISWPGESTRYHGLGNVAGLFKMSGDIKLG